MGEIIGPTSGWIIGPTMSDEAWPAWVNKISVLISVLQIKLNYFNAELHGFCGIIWLPKTVRGS